MASKKSQLFWQGHPVRDEDHHRDLDLRAAIFQFHHGMDRAAAEQRVKHEDRVERHQKAAAHHLDGMRAAYAVGNHEDAQQHHTMYSLHTKALGLDPAGAVPSEVERYRGDKNKKHAYTFKGHEDDQFLVQPVHKASPAQGGLTKSEPPFPASDEEHEANMQKLLGTLEGAGTPELIGGAKQKLISYLGKLGIEGAAVDDVVATHPVQSTPAKPPLRVLEGGEHLSAPKYGHLRVVKMEDWPSILAVWGVLAKADGGEQAQGRVKQFDISRTKLRHKYLPEEQAFDYSSWLTPEQSQKGYKMFVLSHGNGNPVRVHVVHNRQKAGSAHGNVDQGDLEIENYALAGGAHQNQGLEASMLNALCGHAKSKMGANFLSHAPFMPSASALIESIAKPHGFQLGEPEDIDDDETPVDQPPGRLVTGGIKVRSQQPQRVPHSFQPRMSGWWRTAAEEGD